MINYLRFAIKIDPFSEYLSDLLAYELGEIGFESFDLQENVLLAFIQEPDWKEEGYIVLIDRFNKTYFTSISFEKELIIQKNWNEEWEKNYFQPILVDNMCLIRSSFHTNLPSAKYDIVIDPKMSFGTGHHETTSLMLKWILEEPLVNKDVLDMGCGTAVLAILAKMREANKVWAVDIDEWCYINAQENIAINAVDTIRVFQGGAELIENEQFDVIFANINLNVLLAYMSHYVASLSENGTLIMSGFYLSDLPLIDNAAKELGLKQIGYKGKNNWVAVKYCF
jgi:ribosomal protein L11 methyltransferase